MIARECPILLLLLPLLVGIVFCRYTGCAFTQACGGTEESYYRHRAELELRNRQQAAYNPIHWQQALRARYRALGLDGAVLGTLEALTLGYRAGLDQDVQQQFRRSGAAHVLAVSGLHVGILYMVLLWLLTWGGRYTPLCHERGRQWVLSGVIVTLLWGYAALTGYSPSVVRCVLMFSLVELTRVVQRHSSSMNTLALAAFLILVVRPEQLFSVGFQLSFAAVAAILLIRPGRWPLITVSLAAQLGVLPITLYYFGQMSNYFILTNIGVLGLAPLILVTALATLVLGGLPVIGTVLTGILQVLVRMMHDWVRWVDNLPGGTSSVVTDVPMVVCLYGAFISGLLALRRSLWWLTATALFLTAFILLYLR